MTLKYIILAVVTMLPNNDRSNSNKHEINIFELNDSI